MAVQTRQERLTSIDAELATLQEAPVDREALHAALLRQIDEWRAVLGQHVPQTREILRRLLTLPIELQPLDGPTGGLEDVAWATGFDAVALVDALVDGRS